MGSKASNSRETQSLDDRYIPEVNDNNRESCSIVTVFNGKAPLLFVRVQYINISWVEDEVSCFHLSNWLHLDLDHVYLAMVLLRSDWFLSSDFCLK